MKAKENRPVKKVHLTNFHKDDFTGPVVRKWIVENTGYRVKSVNFE